MKTSRADLVGVVVDLSNGELARVVRGWPEDGVWIFEVRGLDTNELTEDELRELIERA